MTTSGTVGLTTVTVSNIIDQAVRRCKFSPAGLNSELIEIAKRDLFMLLSEFADYGLNLWCLEQNLLGLQANRARYPLPTGTINLLKLLHSRPTRATGTETAGAQEVVTELDEATQIKRIGVKFSAIGSSETITFASSDDNVVFTDVEEVVKTDWTTGEYYWFELDPLVTAKYWRVASTTAGITVTTFYLASEVREIPIYAYNRDQFYDLVDRKVQSSLPTNYYYERLFPLEYVNLWPVPNDDDGHLTVIRHRQVQDVGSLSMQLEIPNRWLNAVLWGLADMLGPELPNVDDNRLALVGGKAKETRLVAEREETDSAPTMYQPNIGAYNR